MFAAPPEVAALIDRWIRSAHDEAEHAGWSLDPSKHPMEWIDGPIAADALLPDEPPPAPSDE